MTLRAALTLQGLLLHLLGSLPGSTGIMFRVWTMEELPGWSMTTAERILALKGQSAVLPCSFTSPSPDTEAVIQAIWRLQTDGSSEETMFQCSFFNGTSGETLLNPCIDGNNQYRLVGNPRLNDLSLEVKNVTANGSYYCRVEIKDRAGAEFQTQYATDLVVFGSGGGEVRTWTISGVQGWSMTTARGITGWKGQSAVLPCSFTYPGEAYLGPVRTIWKKQSGSGQDDVFQCDFQNSTGGERQWGPCLTGTDQYRLVGDPRENHLSLEVRGLEFGQSGDYYCRVELLGRPGDMWQTDYDTALLVYAPSRILNLTLEGNDTVVCEVEGDPKPNITWTGPNFLQLSPEQLPEHIVRSTILVTENQTYTCRAENMYGADERSLSLGEEAAAAGRPPDLLLVVLIPVLLLMVLVLLLVLAVLGWKRRDLQCKRPPKRLPSGRKPSDAATLTLEELQESVPEPGSVYADSLSTQKQNACTNEKAAENQDACTYVDIAFTNQPKQGAHQPVSPVQHKEEDIIYAVVAVHKDKQTGPS